MPFNLEFYDEEQFLDSLRELFPRARMGLNRNGELIILVGYRHTKPTEDSSGTFSAISKPRVNTFLRDIVPTSIFKDDRALEILKSFLRHGTLAHLSQEDLKIFQEIISSLHEGGGLFSPSEPIIENDSNGKTVIRGLNFG